MILSKDLLTSPYNLKDYEGVLIAEKQITSSFVGWYSNNARYVGPTGLIPGKKYAYVIYTSGEHSGNLGTTWAGNRFVCNGYNWGLDYRGEPSLTFDYIYNYNNSNRPSLPWPVSKAFQGTFIADADGTSTYIATVAGQKDGKSSSRIRVIDYNLLKQLFIAAKNKDGFFDETI